MNAELDVFIGLMDEPHKGELNVECNLPNLFNRETYYFHHDRGSTFTESLQRVQIFSF